MPSHCRRLWITFGSSNRRGSKCWRRSRCYERRSRRSTPPSGMCKKWNEREDVDEGDRCLVTPRLFWYLTFALNTFILDCFCLLSWPQLVPGTVACNRSPREAESLRPHAGEVRWICKESHSSELEVLDCILQYRSSGTVCFIHILNKFTVIILQNHSVLKRRIALLSTKCGGHVVVGGITDLLTDNLMFCPCIQ